MTEIPEDIRKAAQACYEACEYGDSGEIVDCIGAAILAERNHWNTIVEERDLLRQAVVRYCDHSRMGTVEPMSVQQAIDDAFAATP